MGAWGHTLTSTPFCFVVRQCLVFFPGQVHVFKVSFDNVHLVLYWSSQLSFIAFQFPLCRLAGYPGVVHSQDVSHPSQSSFFNCIPCNFREPSLFFLMSSFLTLSFHVITINLLWNSWWAASSFFIRVTEMLLSWPWISRCGDYW